MRCVKYHIEIEGFRIITVLNGDNLRVAKPSLGPQQHPLSYAASRRHGNSKFRQSKENGVEARHCDGCANKESDERPIRSVLPVNETLIDVRAPIGIGSPGFVVN